MTTLLLIAFLGLVGGCFLMLSLSPFELADNVAKPFRNRKKTLAQKSRKPPHPSS